MSKITLLPGDCLERMAEIPAGSVDMILCDLPYGTTQCKWDAVIALEPLWAQYRRVIKGSGAIVLTAAQPFTSALVMSNPKMFRYSLVWDKVNKYTGALNANKMPLRRHEDIAVFYGSQPSYNKQFREGKPYSSVRTKGHGMHTQYGNPEDDKRRGTNDGNHNPCSVIQIKGDNKKEAGLHPTQKPVELFEYLIKTYTNEGETVLDNCAGSGTAAVAALNTGRNAILIERDMEYCHTILKRLAA